MVSRILNEWYHSLFSRRVDLVSDYAGAELFYIEGDSLLLHVFSDDKLDFSLGFQVLHVVYLVESFLQKLLQRNCAFEIVFFNKNSLNCIPGGVPEGHEARYLLAREIILQHLSHIQADSRIPMQVFESYKSPEFRDYLRSSGGYFFMCHDGVGTEVVSNKQDAVMACMKDGAHQPNHNLRNMILRLINYGYSIALINSTEFRDTKIMAVVMHGSPDSARRKLLKIDDAYFLEARPEDAHDSDATNLSTLPDEVRCRVGAMILSQSSYAEKQEKNKPKSKDLAPSFPPGTLLGVGNLLKDAISFQGDLTQCQYLTAICISYLYKTSCISVENLEEVQAMLLHTILISELDLSARQIMTLKPGKKESDFLDNFVRVAFLVLSSKPWKDVMREVDDGFDLYDLLDGRLFFAVFDSELPRSANFQASSLSIAYNILVSLTEKLCGIGIHSEISGDEDRGSIMRNYGQGSSSTIEITGSVLPFQNKVFDQHLRSVHLSLSGPMVKSSSGVVFRELTHWHNRKRALDPRTHTGLSPWQKSRLLRRNQRYMTEMRDYAASLTNSTGGILRPESLVVHAKSGKRSQPAPKLSAKPEEKASKTHVSGIKTQRKGKNHKVSVRDSITMEIGRKQLQAAEKQIDKWKFIRKKEFDTEKDLESQLAKVKKHLLLLAQDSRTIVEAEIQTYILDILVRMLLSDVRKEHGSRHKQMSISALAWDAICRISKLKQGVTIEMVSFVGEVITRLGLAKVQLQVNSDRKLSFELVDLAMTSADLRLGMPAKEFQLAFTGPFMDRNMDSAFDARTPEFEPDQWQRDVLDQIDARRSLFVVAPTSAGKTFISFYAMKQVLQEDDDGILVYVAPTKALVNQIAAEVQARFSKTYPSKTTSKSVWAMHTRDHRVNDPTSCQILVTVPHVLQIMLLGPGNANTWSPRVRRIIFDEIHCIGQSDDGIVWEQLLLLSPCPVIALSATVGNPEEFYHWLKLAQEANGIELRMVQHQHRYSELRKFHYHAPKQFSFTGLSRPESLPLIGLDNVEGLDFIHPVSCLIDPSRGMPPDLNLESRDCLTLWKTMKLHQTPKFPVDDSLAPEVALPNMIRKVDVIDWQNKLKSLLQLWMKSPGSPFEKVVGELGRPKLAAEEDEEPNAVDDQTSKDTHSDTEKIDKNNLLHTTLPLVCSLYEQNALPAIFFNYDRSWCEGIARRLLGQLQEAEDNWKAFSSSWKMKLDKWEQWKKLQEKQSRVRPPHKSKKGKGDDEGSREDRLRERLSQETNAWELFDPERPIENFTLADRRKMPDSQFQEYAASLREREIDKWLIDALERGIGVHHAGMNRRYRQICEVLFRKGFLRVVIATGTLALGINMPCKTVVFSGDSIFLTALNFRQASGRAGRRGFDLLGNVVFQDIPKTKVSRLISSRLPDLKGHFPITTSLVLRMCILLHQSDYSAHAINSINSLLSCPRICLGGPEMKDTVLHHLRFSIEYLQRNNLIDGTGQPLNFAGFVSHLYYTETSSFAFHALLQSGYLHDLTSNLSIEPKETLVTLMLVMAHLFGRRPLTNSTMGQYRRLDRSSSSIVTLPPLPDEAARVLLQHNQETLKIYTAYVSSFIKQHVKEPDCILPLSQVKCGGDKCAASAELGFSSSVIASGHHHGDQAATTTMTTTRITSNFVALSGHGDHQLKSISDLCRMVRAGVWLEESVIPHIPIYLDENETRLNAYLYDFFKHGNTHELEIANGIRRGEQWFVLNDFSMILATIITALENLAGSNAGGQSDMLDVVSGGDAQDGERENKLVEAELRNEGMVNVDDGQVDPDRLSLPTSSLGDNHQQQQHRGSLSQVLAAFKLLREEFDLKFKVMWA